MGTSILAYLAGFTDGEGLIGVAKHKRIERRTPAYEPQLRVGNTGREVLDLYVKTFGGKIIHARRKTTGGKDFYQWEIYGVAMVKALEQMLPYLILKREQAKLVIELQRRRWEAKAKGCKELDQNELATRERIYQRIKMLQGKVRQLSFTVEDTNAKQRQLF